MGEGARDGREELVHGEGLDGSCLKSLSWRGGRDTLDVWRDG